jgi:hypothetical protein
VYIYTNKMRNGTPTKDWYNFGFPRQFGFKYLLHINLIILSLTNYIVQTLTASLNKQLAYLRFLPSISNFLMASSPHRRKERPAFLLRAVSICLAPPAHFYTCHVVRSAGWLNIPWKRMEGEVWIRAGLITWWMQFSDSFDSGLSLSVSGDSTIHPSNGYFAGGFAVPHAPPPLLRK